MKKQALLFSLIAIGFLITTCPHFTTAQEKTETYQVYFSPGSAPTEAIIKHLNSAKKTVLIQAVQLTLPAIEKPLSAAHARGVTIQIILDKKETTRGYSSAIHLHNKGIKILTDSKHPTAHNKIIIIDGEIVTTGSFNFTKKAEKNAENLIIIRDQKIALIYTKNWEEHAEHSKPYVPKQN